MTSRYPRTFPADEASSWRRIRRYAVPRWMIERATERRLAGDWQGACAAANVDVTFDLPDVAKRHGADAGKALEGDLRSFAPDLLRWHLPRYLRGRTTLRPGQCVILTSYGDQAAVRLHLHVTTSRMIDGSQRLTLRCGPVDHEEYVAQYGTVHGVHDWTSAQYLWDVRHASELRERHAGTSRLPFHEPDGTLRRADQLPAADPGLADLAGHTEWVTLLHDQGDIARAYAAAGITIDETPPEMRYGRPPSIMGALGNRPIALTRIQAEIERLVNARSSDRFQIRYGQVAILLESRPQLGSTRGPARTSLNIRLASPGEATGVEHLTEAYWRRLPDLDLLRFGDITPDELHPLVSASLFPGRRVASGTDGPPDPQLPVSVRVRCRGGWHEVRSQDGRLQIPHSADEERRERAMRAFGGPVAGCFAAKQAWTTGTGRLPKALRDQRREFFGRVQHGDSPGVLSLLDSGVDPHVRNGREQTLLHLLHLLDHDLLLPRLLAAGLNIEARDQHQQTPLYVAVNQGPPGLVRALLDAGARTDIADHNGRRLSDIVIWHEREDLPFLADMVKRDYPDPESPRMTRERPYG